MHALRGDVFKRKLLNIVLTFDLQTPTAKTVMLVSGGIDLC